MSVYSSFDDEVLMNSLHPGDLFCISVIDESPHSETYGHIRFVIASAPDHSTHLKVDTITGHTTLITWNSDSVNGIHVKILCK